MPFVRQFFGDIGSKMSKPEFESDFHNGVKDVSELNIHHSDHDELLDVEGIEAEGFDVSDDEAELDGINDVYLVVEGRRLAASRAVLCLASPVFKAMFDGFDPDKKYVELHGKKFSGVKEFYKCINPRVMEVLTVHTVYTILPLADEYRVESLLKKCRVIIPDLVHCSMGAEGLCRHLHLAVNYDLNVLESKCVALCSELKLPEMVRWMDHFNIPTLVQLKVRDRALRRREIEEDDSLVITKLFDETIDKYINKKKNKTLISISFEVLLQRELCNNHFKKILYHEDNGKFGFNDASKVKTSTYSANSNPFSNQLFESSQFNFGCSSDSSSKEKMSAVAPSNRKSFSPTPSFGLFGTTATTKSKKDDLSTSSGVFGIITTTAKSDTEKNSTVTTLAIPKPTQGSPLSIKPTEIVSTVPTTTMCKIERSTTATTSGGLFGTSSTTSGLFGTSSTTGVLFGTSSTTNGLFGTSSTTGGLFGTSSTTGGLFGTSSTTDGSDSKKQSATPIFGTTAKSGVISTTTPSGGLFGTGVISVSTSSYSLLGGKKDKGSATSAPLQGLFGTKTVTTSSETKSSTQSPFSFIPVAEETPTRSLSSPLFGIKNNAASSHAKEPNMSLLGYSAKVDDISTSMNTKADVTITNVATNVQRDDDNKMREGTTIENELKNEDFAIKPTEETTVQRDDMQSGNITAITSVLPLKTEEPRDILKILQGMRLLYKYLPREKSLKVATVQYMRNKIETLTQEEKDVYNLLPTQVKLDVKGRLVKEIPDKSF